MLTLQNTVLFVIATLILTSCGNNETHQESTSEESIEVSPVDSVEEEVSSKNQAPKNWEEIKSAIVNRDAAGLKEFASEKINSDRFDQLTKRIFQEDVNQSFSAATFESLTSIGQGGQEVYAYYFVDESRQGDRASEHDIEIYLKLLPDGLSLWNFSIAD